MRALRVVDVIVTAIVQSILGGVNISAAREPYSARMLRERPRAFDEPERRLAGGVAEPSCMRDGAVASFSCE